MELISFYIIIGVIGGITAGMLGLGGGIIFVPGLLLVHKFFDLFVGYELQAAVYSSLVCIIFAGSSSSYLHYKNNLINSAIVKRFSFLVASGCFIGIFLLEHLSSEFLENIYSIILILLAFLLFSDSRIIKNNIAAVKNIGGLYFLTNGIISSLMGIGGGTLSVPYLSFIINDIKQSIATASAIGLIIAIASIIFMYLINTNIFFSKLNYTSLIIIIPASILGSFIGVSMLKLINQEKVKIVFSSLLMIVAIYLMID